MVAGKQKICAFAPVKVVKALAGLERTPMSLASKATQQQMIQLVEAMRNSISAESGELKVDISDILFSAEAVAK